MVVRASAGNTDRVLLRWDEGPYAGLEVTCRREASLSLRLAFFHTAANLLETHARNQRFGSEVLLEWNLADDDDQPIAADGDGFTSIPPSLAWDIVNRWVDEVAAVPAPLGDESSSGDTSVEESLSMTPLSESPGS